MKTRDYRLIGVSLLSLTLSGCGGGPTNRDLCLAIIAAMPVVYVITLCVLWLLEWIRGAPDRDTGSLWREALATTGGMVVLSALMLAIGGRPDRGEFILALLAFGAVALGVSLVLWKARSTASYASRILRAAQIGSALGLPALVLWPTSLDAVANVYIRGLATVSLLGAIYGTPLLLVGMVIQAIVRRRKRGETPPAK